jgi:hypothetical protein
VTAAWKVGVIVIKIPFGHRHRKGEETPRVHRRSHRSWLQREDAGIAHGPSTLFFIAHETPLPPAATCIQGHEVRAGESTCDHGHPLG